MERGPIFIGGLDRCGKTTLRAFLTSHPNISIPAVGSNMWTYFYGQYGDLNQAGNFERCLEAMLHYKHVLYLNPDAESIRREFWRGPATYARLFALFQEQHAQREGKPRWGDQTGLIERYTDQVFEAYPGSKLIHMIRDPRDRYAASLALWPKGKGRVGGAAARWLYSTRLAERNLTKYPGRYKIVQYEDIIRESEQTLEDICAFIGEEYVPEMLTMPGAPEHHAKLIKGLNGEIKTPPLSEQYIGIYRRHISKRELAILQGLVKKQMAVYRYSLDNIHFSPSERFSHLFMDWPVNLFRMASWLSIEIVNHNLPGIFGRQPAASMVIKKDSGAIGRTINIRAKP
jgi:hypothetical protein